MFDHKSDWIKVRWNIWRSCVWLLPLYLYPSWEMCVRSTMLLSLYFCWEGILNIWIMCSIHVTMYLFLERVRLNIWRSSVRSTLLCIFVGSCVWSTLLFIFVGRASLLEERLCIFVERAWDHVRPNIWRFLVRSTLNAASTS